MSDFATTRWSIILEARGDPGHARDALETICRAYRAPVLAYVRRSGHPRSEAEDITQEFFMRLLERRWDTRADPARGRFRSFLLAALKRFLIDRHAAAHALKRGGDQQQLDWDSAAERLVAPGSESPEHAFERAWAIAVLEHAWQALREEAVRAGRVELFEQLAPYLVETAEATDYHQLGSVLGIKPNTLAVSVHRLRLRLRELVRAELAEQTEDAAAAEHELQVLRAALLAGGAAVEE